MIGPTRRRAGRDRHRDRADGADSLADEPIARGGPRRAPRPPAGSRPMLSADGVAELIAGSPGPLGSLTPLRRAGREPRGRRGAERDRGRRARARRPQRARPRAGQGLDPGFFAAFPRVRAGAARAAARRDSLAYLGFGDPGEHRPRPARPGERAGAGDRGRLRGPGRRPATRGRGRSSSASCSTRSAARRRSRSSRRSAAARPAAPAVPDVRRRRGRRGARPRALAALQAPLADAVDPGSDLQAPVFGQQQIAGVEARSLRISPTVELTYAIFDGLAVIATDPARHRAASPSGEGGLDDAELYERGHRRASRTRSRCSATSTSTSWSRSASSSGSPRTPSTRRSPASSAASRRSGSRSAEPTTCSRPTRALLLGGPTSTMRRVHPAPPDD